MEKSLQIRKEESGGDCVQHDEDEIRREFQFQRRNGTTKRAVDLGGPAQHRTIELLGVCREVIYSTGPRNWDEPEVRSSFYQLHSSFRPILFTFLVKLMVTIKFSRRIVELTCHND